MEYARALKDVSRALALARVAAQDDFAVTVAEYNNLNEISSQISKLRHKQWQRDTFAATAQKETI